MADRPVSAAPADIRPRMALRLGVTGHRWTLNADNAGEIARMRAQVDLVLDRCAAVAASVATAHADFFTAAPPRLLAVSSLAEGADRLLATQALRAGWTLEVVLPFAASVYEADFANAGSLAEFEALTAQAVSVFEIGDPRKDQDASAAYETAGLVMLDHADVIVAIWDGGESRGRGGTREIVDEALRRGIPVVWIHTGAGGTVSLWDGATAWPLTPIDTAGVDPLQKALVRLLGPPQSELAGEAIERLRSFLDEPMRQPNALERGFDRAVRAVASAPAEGAPLPSLRDFVAALPPAGRLSSAMRDLMMRRLTWTEDREAALGAAERRIAIATFAFGLLAVALGVLAVLSRRVPLTLAIFAGLEVAVLALLFRVRRTGEPRRLRQASVDARRLAERLREALLLAPLGRASNNPTLRSADAGDRWTFWYAQAAARELSLPSVCAETDYVRAVADATAAYAIGPELRAQTTLYRLARAAHRRRGRASLRAFSGALALAGVSAALAGLAAAGLIGGFATAVALGMLAALCAMLPAFGLALAGIRAEMGGDAIAERALVTARELDRLKAQLARSPAQLYRPACLLQRRVADAMASQTRLTHPAERQLTIPG